MKTYLFSYYHDDAQWSFEIKADSPEDAKARLKKLPLATYDGELMAKLPAYIPGSGLWARLLTLFKNL